MDRAAVRTVALLAAAAVAAGCTARPSSPRTFPAPVVARTATPTPAPGAGGSGWARLPSGVSLRGDTPSLTALAAAAREAEEARVAALRGGEPRGAGPYDAGAWDPGLASPAYGPVGYPGDAWGPGYPPPGLGYPCYGPIGGLPFGLRGGPPDHPTTPFAAPYVNMVAGGHADVLHERPGLSSGSGIYAHDSTPATAPPPPHHGR